VPETSFVDRAARRLSGLPLLRLLDAFVDLRRLVSAPSGLVHFVRDLLAYRRLPGAEPVRLRELWPMLADRVETSPFDRHYFHQDAWAARRIAEHGPVKHVDVASRVDLAGFLTAITDVTYVDIRPLTAQMPRLTSVAGSVLALPYGDRTLESVSCLHVAEHIGLGRYGDPLDPDGTRKAAKELQRVLAPGGELLFSLPVGRPQLVFNAHRVHDPATIIGYFDDLELAEFSGVDDAGAWGERRDPQDLAGSDYACGCFRFRRPAA
jgi:SAM-dependent methyltransferase